MRFSTSRVSDQSVIYPAFNSRIPRDFRLFASVWVRGAVRQRVDTDSKAEAPKPFGRFDKFYDMPGP